MLLREPQKRVKPWGLGPKAAFSVVLLLAGTAFAAGWNPPTGRVHAFTQASDYDADRDSGCTNSGEGCHGAERDYADFNAYHPDTECATCHEYQGVGCLPCHSPQNSECMACHDGTMPNASDCVRLAEPYPNGHYSETTHTATGTDMSEVVRSAEGGEAGLDCSECHARDLRSAHQGVPLVEGSEYGEDIGCGECHNDTRSHGLDQVGSDWKNRACEDCHREDSSSPMHSASIAPAVESTGAAGCADSGPGCHSLHDLHALHPDAPKTCSGSAEDDEPGCHDLEVESHKPTAKGCGGDEPGACHRPYLPDELSHRSDGELHSPKTDGPASDMSFNGIACGACHHMSPDGVSLLTEHRLGTSAASLSEDGCHNCHDHEASLDAIENDWEDRDTKASCSTCHDGLALDPVHDEDVADKHTVAIGSEGCADSGMGCHPTSDLSSVGAPTTSGGVHRDCLRCHDRTRSQGNRSYDPLSRTCGSGRACHAEPGAYDPDTAIHGGGGDAPIDGRDAKHTAGSGQSRSRLSDEASGTDTACSTCHDMRLGVEHARPNSAFSGGCTGCHNESAGTADTVKSDWAGKDSDDACAACHRLSHFEEVHGDIDRVHAAIEISHKGEQQVGACAKAGCHPTADVRVVHADAGCAISGCHSDSGDIAGDRVMTCGGTADTEGSCHIAGQRHSGADAAHVATEINHKGEQQVGACAKAGCHPTADVRGLHETDHCYTAGCHVEGGPTYMTCGGTADTEGSCHIAGQRHSGADAAHVATEVDAEGVAQEGACASVGCHPTTDVRALHDTHHCYTAGCHVEGGPTYMTCGGAEGQAACHLGFGIGYHAVDHSADLSGTVGGITYEPGANIGCLGECHSTDLVGQHSSSMGAMEGSAATVCRVCHADDRDSGTGAFAALPAVTAAVDAGDRRCVSCHASGSETDGPEAVASPTAACLPDTAPASVETVGTIVPVRQTPSVALPPTTNETTATPEPLPAAEDKAGGEEPVTDPPAVPEDAADESEPEEEPAAAEGVKKETEEPSALTEEEEKTSRGLSEEPRAEE